ncbi:MAG: glycosyltransferase family 39 protein [Gemmataceae bacterium]|nr:glycosyltransferase family 39 protein [Gemmataceae bacterium]
MSVWSRDAVDSSSSKPWWREAPVAWLILLVMIVYSARIAETPLRGEETRWALVAKEMVQSGDWIVPRQQDEAFLNRPPLHCWLIAATGVIRGAWDTLTYRLPSLAGTLFITLLIYGYARVSLNQLGALAAAAAFATMAELLQTGRLAETDAVFIPLVGASLLVWHWGYLRGWPDWRTWTAGYGFMALAALTKGPQAPIYFVGAVGAYLIVAGQWRRLFTWGHALGIVTAAAIVGAWALALVAEQGWEGAGVIWGGQTALRLHGWRGAEVARHLLQFPFEVIACTLPWSLFLVAYLSRRFRNSLRSARPVAVFLGTCLAVAFPTCWVPPEGRTRYFAPLYPCLAVLIGLVIQRCAELRGVEFRLAGRLRRTWTLSMIALAGVMMLAAGGLVAASMFPEHPRLAPWAGPPVLTACYALASVALAALACRARHAGDPRHILAGGIALTGFMGIVIANVVTDAHVRNDPDTAAAMAQVHGRLPHATPLVSLNPIHHRFAYYHGKPIAQAPWPTAAHAADERLTYFCFDAAKPGRREALPFAWEEVAVVSMERRQRRNPREVVIVGRRVHEELTATSAFVP